MKRDYNKYHVIKREDSEEYLNSDESLELAKIISKINLCRLKEGRRPNRYLVLNEDLPFVKETWIKLEEHIDNKEKL